MVRAISRLTLSLLALFIVFAEAYAQSGISFRVNHTSTVQYFQCRQFINTRDNGTVMIGKHGTNEDMADLMIMKLDHLGKKLWSKKIVVDQRLDNYFLCETTDGNIVLTASSQYNGAPRNSDLLLIKLSCTGEIVWNKHVTLQTGVSHRFLNPFALNPGKNNDVLLSFYSGELNWKYLVISRINAAGDMVWSKTFYGTDAETNHPAVPFISGNKVVVLGFNDLYRNSWNFDKSFFGIMINYDDGIVENTIGYNYSEHPTYYGVLITEETTHFYAEQLSDGGYALFGEFSNYDLQHHYFYKLILNNDLSIRDKITYSTSFELGEQHSKMKVFPNGQSHILMMHSDYKTVLWYASDPLNQKIREKKLLFPEANLDSRFNIAHKGSDKSTIIGSKMSAPLGSIEMIQLQDGDGSINNCLGNDSSVIQLVSWQVYNGTMAWEKINNNEVVINNLSFSERDNDIMTSYLCAPPNNGLPSQASLKIIGDISICSVTSPYLFTGRSSAKLPATWVTNSPVVLDPVNDSVVRLTFNKSVQTPEKFKLFVTAGSCEVLIDSVEITVYPNHVSLPKKYTDCDLPLTLEPDSFAKNYLWDNGSTERIRTVRNPGKYYLRMENYCGEIIFDTVLVSAGSCGSEPPPPSGPIRNTIHVPNAFTPNADGKNDTFKPAITGNLSSYELIIFNRWGQIVFRTSDYRTGWDGNLKDAPQSSNIFAYRIIYKFENELIKAISGTGVLVR
jgi:gliding motility-associated-like protein